VKDDGLYLIHIGECIARIEYYVAGGRQSFMEATLIQDAVMRNLQTLAQSAQRLSGTIKDSHPEVNWRGMAGFRNVLVHDYLGVRPDRVWEVVEQDLPALKHQVEAILQGLEERP
jgi:uncharacterized protein with HEPN domain